MELREPSSHGTGTVGRNYTRGGCGEVGDERMDENLNGTVADSGTGNGSCVSYIKKAKHWWFQNISLVRDHTSDGPTGGDPRDYLALERTYLGWFRTSSAAVTLGVVITQLFVLKDVDRSKGKILGSILAGGGIITNIIGCERYFRQQRLLARGKALTGGLYHVGMLALLSIIILALFLVVLVEV